MFVSPSQRLVGVETNILNDCFSRSFSVLWRNKHFTPTSLSLFIIPRLKSDTDLPYTLLFIMTNMLTQLLGLSQFSSKKKMERSQRERHFEWLNHQLLPSTIGLDVESSSSMFSSLGLLLGWFGWLCHKKSQPTTTTFSYILLLQL